MKDTKELALRVAEAAGVKGFHWDGSLFDFVEPFLAAYLAEQEPVAQIDEFGVFKDLTDDYLPEGTKLYAAPPEPAPQQQKPQTTIGDSADPAQPTAVCAAPSSEEVREMVERLRNMSQGVWPYKRAADMIERLAARVDDLKQANDGLATAGILPDGCVVVQRKVTEDGRCALATPGNYRTYQDQWNALIAAGEVKTC